MRTVELAFQILELVNFHQPVGVTDLARLTNLPKSTVQRTLVALSKTGWIAPATQNKGQWKLTMRAVITTAAPNEERDALRSVALPVMEELRRECEETIHLSYRFGRKLVLIERLDGIKPVRYFNAYGAVARLTTTSSGRAILSRLDQATLAEYLADPSITATHYRDGDDYMAEIDAARCCGYAISERANRPDVNAVAAAILNITNQPIAALSISAPADRMPRELMEQHAPYLVDAVRRIRIGVELLGHKLYTSE